MLANNCKIRTNFCTFETMGIFILPKGKTQFTFHEIYITISIFTSLYNFCHIVPVYPCLWLSLISFKDLIINPCLAKVFILEEVFWQIPLLTIILSISIEMDNEICQRTSSVIKTLGSTSKACTPFLSLFIYYESFCMIFLIKLIKLVWVELALNWILLTNVKHIFRSWGLEFSL